MKRRRGKKWYMGVQSNVSEQRLLVNFTFRENLTKVTTTIQEKKKKKEKN